MSIKLPKKIILQKGLSQVKERSACMLTSATHDIPLFFYSDQDILKSDCLIYQNDLTEILVVGSVEYLTSFYLNVGINIPVNRSYPKELNSFLHRSIWQEKAGNINQTCFIKPVEIKKFTGFVYYPDEPLNIYNSGEVGDLYTFKSLPDDTIIYCSDKVNFIAEFRLYIANKKIMGMARYDSHDNGDLLPDLKTVQSMIDQCQLNYYALDVGILDSGETALVECNDAWALGLYSENINPINQEEMNYKQYIELLYLRWLEMLGNK